MSWWGPLAIIGGALGGALVGYLLLAAAGSGRPREAASPGPLGFRPTTATSELRWNPAAFLAVACAVAVVAGLAIGLALT